MQGWDTRRRWGGNYDQNVGVPGVVYVLENDGLRSGFVKIGCTRHSGDHRARSLNDDANTGTPGTFRCVFEFRTQDCGTAEKKVFVELEGRRRGKWGQEFFEVELAHAREIIERVCQAVDAEIAARPPAPSQPPAIDSVSSQVPLPAAGMRPPPWERPLRPPARSRHRPSLILLLMPIALAGYFWIKHPPLAAPGQKVAAQASARAPAQRAPQKKPAQARSGIFDMNGEERESLEAACSGEKSSGAPMAYDRCKQRLLDKMASAPPPADLSGLNALELSSLTSACSRDKYVLGPAALRACQVRQVEKLREMSSHVDLTGLSRDVRMSVDAACEYAKHTLGPADYYQCAADQLEQMSRR